MRFIQLKLKRRAIHYDSVVKFCCGPNFVLNRADLFEKMIECQGGQFWFRFWLNFRFTPGCYDLNAVKKQWPEMTTYIDVGVHNQFLLASPRKAARYCLERVIKPMLIVSPRKSRVVNRSGTYVFEELLDLVIKCWGLAFGCALCHCFFKWLIAEDMKFKSENYWEIPTAYLNQDFEPGLFEKFLVCKWGGKLVSLLGFNESAEIPDWLKNLLVGSSDEELIMKEIRYKSVGKYDLIYVQNTAEFMREIRNGRKRAIQEADERPRKKNYKATLNRLPVYRKKRNIKGMKSHEPPPKRLRPILAKTSVPLSLRSSCVKGYRHCYTCGINESPERKLKKCKRCVDEKWPHPRYYCSVNCQVVDWYSVHHLEHARFKFGC